MKTELSRLATPPRIVALALVLSALVAGPAAAASRDLVEHVDGQFESAAVIDAATGELLYAKQAHRPLPPASMVKMMTELIVLERIAAGELSLADSVTVSARASKIGGSQVYLKQGERFTVEDLLRALAIHSANDAATALAEHVAGSSAAFVELMNARARELQMSNTVFHSVHGLPPGRDQESDLSSAYDMALLGRALATHPEALAWASQAEAPFRGGAFILHNPNPLVGKFPGLDGLKTGYTRPAGYCLTATAARKGGRLISVVMGSPSSKVRSEETSRLLTRAFNQFTQVKLVDSANLPLAERVAVKGGRSRDLVVAYGAPLVVSVRKDRAEKLKLENRLPRQIAAPVAAGAVVGTAAAVLDDRVLAEVPIVSLEAIDKGSFFQRLFK